MRPVPGPSSIDRLPSAVRDALNDWIRDPAISQVEATRRTNELLAAAGAEEERISKSAVNRYAVRMREVGKDLQQSREVAEVMIGKLGSAPGGQIGHLVVEIVRTIAFDVTLALKRQVIDDESLPSVLAALRSLSLTAQRLERSSEISERRARQIRRDAAEELARQVEKRQQAQPRRRLTGDDIRRLAVELYGA